MVVDRLRLFIPRTQEGLRIHWSIPEIHVFELIPGTFPKSLGDRRRFDVITMLALLEHASRHAVAERDE